MENRIQFRTLTAQEIDVRPTDTKVRGKATLLLYKNARVDMQILDDSVGEFGWQKRYEDLGGKVYCYIGIQHPTTHEWIWKGDCGMESNIDAAKGEASDASKRAAANWGIGRELYNTPKVKIDCPDRYYYNDKLTMTFSVQEIEWTEDRKCKHLVIVDRFGNEVYRFDAGQKEERSNQEYHHQQEEKKSTKDTLVEFCKLMKLEPTTDQDQLEKFYRFYAPKTEEWKGTFQASTLWSRWMATAR